MAASSLPHSPKHQYLIDEVTSDFLSTLSDVPNNKWLDALLLVPHTGLNGERLVPKLLVDLEAQKQGIKHDISRYYLLNIRKVIWN